MPKKFRASINKDGSGIFTDVYVEANNAIDAERLLQAQYPGHRVSFLKEIEPETVDQTSADPSASKGGCGTIVVAFIAILAIGAWQASRTDTSTQENLPDTALGQDSSQPDFIEQEEQVEEVLPVDSAPEAGPIQESDVQVDPASPEVNGIDPVEQDEVIRAPAEPEAMQKIETMRSYDVEVEAPSGRTILKVSAKNVEEARRIVRDFRGNPPVISVSEQTN